MEMPDCHFVSVDAKRSQQPVTKVRWAAFPLAPFATYRSLKQQFILRFFSLVSSIHTMVVIELCYSVMANILCHLHLFILGCRVNLYLKILF